MATAAVFRASADQLDSHASDLLASFSNVDAAWSGDVVTGGRLQLTVERAVDATHANVMAAVTDLHDLAEECRRRAVVCDQYASELALYQSRYRNYQRAYDDWSHDPDARAQDRPSPPSRPASPPHWVDVPNGSTW